MSEDKPIIEEENSFRQHPLITLAQRIANGEAGQFVYCLQDNNFYMYEDGYWRDIFPTEFIEKITNNLIVRNNKILNRYDIHDRKKVVENFKILKYRHLSEFNSMDLLNFKEGMYDVRGNNLAKHDEKYLSTIRIPYKYDMKAECPLWISTLEGIFEGDKNKIDVLQEYMGSCLTKDVSREKSMLLLGESRSGKSTILETISNMLGENNVSSVALENLSNAQYTSLLINKMVNIDWDVASGAEKFEANFKIITSGEPVNVNDKYIKPFTFRPYCKLILAANKFPRITDTSSAFYKRLILLPCDRIFAPEEQDIRLKKKLKEELPGIFNWSLKGYYRLEKRGIFDIHKEFMIDAISDLREESNPVESFFDSTIVTDVSGEEFIEKHELYERYRRWCLDNGNSALSAIKFGQAVFQKYSKFTPKKCQHHATGKRIWRNIRYKIDEDFRIIKSSDVSPQATHQAMLQGSRENNIEVIDWEN